MNELMDIYIEDMKEHLEILNKSLMLLEKSPGNKDLINEIFRAFHTMKSSTAAMEFNRSAEFIHSMEDLLHSIREGKAEVTTEIINLLFSVHDLLEFFISNVIEHGSEGEVQYKSVISKLENILKKGFNNVVSRIAKGIKSDKQELDFEITKEELNTIYEYECKGYYPYKLVVTLAKDCVLRTARSWMVFRELEEISEILRSSPEIPTDDEVKSGAFNFTGLSVKALIVSKKSEEEIMEALNTSLTEIENIFVETVKLNTDKNSDDVSETVSNIIEAGDTRDLAEENKTDIVYEYAVEMCNGTAGDNDKSYADSPETDSQMTKNNGDQKSGQKNSSYVRIDSQKVDNLIDLLGELLITQSLHKQEITEMFEIDNGIMNNVISMERITKEIQDISMSLRMVTLKQTFQKISRTCRDTAFELGKEVNLSIIGEETEIDRSIVEKIHDPLMHLIRNSVYHGIECEAERKSKGKPVCGSISLKAYNKRGNVYIEVSDDGRGISIDKVYQKALAKEIIDSSKNYSDEEIVKFIFLPGFSTEESTNNISGRGVGMNVVETEIGKIGGKIETVNRPGKGCTFILKIPVNLATINGTIISLCSDRFVIPTLNIKQILKPEKEQWVSVKGKTSMIKIRNDIIPVIPVNEILDLTNYAEKSEQDYIVVILEHNQKLKALPAKSILGKQEIVVKPAGTEFRELNFISGATILGDGRVSLILDVESLFKMAEEIGD